MAATLTISAGVVDSLTANPSSVIGYSSTKNIVIDGDITHTQASALKNVASPSITATVSQTTVANLKAITTLSGRTNAFTFTTSDTSAAAADLVAIKGLSSIAPNFSSVTAITASTFADTKSLYTGTNTTLGNETIILSDTTISAADLNTANGYSTKLVTTQATKLTGEAADLKTAFAAKGTSGDKIGGIAAIATEVSGTDVPAEDLLTIDAATTGTVTITGSSVSGKFADVKSVYDATQTDPATITGLSDKNITLDNSNTGATTYSVANINTVSGYTSGVVTAEVKETDLDTIKGLTESGHNLTITVNTKDGTVVKLSAADLKAVDAKTTGTITLASAITDIDGNIADVTAVLTSSGISRDKDEKSTISDSITVAQANVIDAETSGVITATISDNTIALLDGLTLNTDSNGDPVAHKYTITVSDSTVDAGKLNTLDKKTSIAPTISALTITGTLDEVHTMYKNFTDSTTFAGLNNEAVTISDTTLDAAKLKYVEDKTSGDVTVSATTITGLVADVETVYDKKGSGIAGLTGAEAVTLTDVGEIAADKVDAVEADTTGLVTLDTSKVTTIAGTYANAKKVFDHATTVYEADGVTVKTAATIANGLSVNYKLSDAKTVNTNTIANLMGIATGITGTLEANVYAAGDDQKLDKLIDGRISETGHKLAIDVKTQGTANELEAAKLLTLDGLTTGTVNVLTNVTELQGSAADIASVYAASGITMVGDEKAKITGLEVTAADVVAICNTTSGGTDGTSGVVTISHASAFNLVGSSSDVKKVITEKESGVGAKIAFTTANPTVTVSGAVAAAADIDYIDSKTTGLVTIAAASLSGTAANIKKVHDSSGSTGTATIAMTVDDGTGVATVANLNTVDSYTTGVITATVKETDLATLTGIAEANNLTITVKDATVDAAALKAVNAKTTGKITLHSDVTKVNGTAADVLEAFDKSLAGTEMTGLTKDEAVVITGGASVAQINSIGDHTSGLITASITDTDLATLEGITETTNKLTITVKDTTVDAAKLITVDGKTSETITIDTAVTTVSGTLANINSVIDSTGITGETAKDFTVTDSITQAEELALDDKITGHITATISDNYLDKLKLLTDDASVVHNLTITVKGNSTSDSTIAAADLKTVEALTTVVVTVDPAVTGLTGGMADVTTVIDKDKTATTPTISGLDTVDVTISGTKTTNTNTIDKINNIIDKTTGVVTATVYEDGDDKKLDKLIAADGGLKGTGNKIDINIDTDETANTNGAAKTVRASSLLSLYAKTTGLITIGTNITAIDGTAANLASIYAVADDGTAATSRITGLAAEAVTVIDAAVAGVGGVVSAADLKTIEKGTTGTITLTNVAAIEGTFSDVEYVMVTKKASFANEQADAVNITDAVTVANLETITTATSGVVTATVSDTDITKLANLTEVGDSHKLTITLNDSSVDATKLKTLETTTAGVVTVNSTAVTGAMDDIASVYSEATTAIAGLGNETITCTDADVTIAEANAMTGYTTGLVTATIAKDSIADLIKDGTGLNSSSNAYAVEVSDTAVTAGDLKALDLRTTGTITATDATSISGALSDVKSLYESNVSGGITGLGNEAVTITDTGTVSASAINYVNSNTSGALTLNKATTITGTVADVKATYAAYSSGTITGLGNEAITIVDLGTTITSSVLAELKALTTGNVTVSLSGTTITATDLNTLDADSTESVNAGGVTTITGSSADVKKAYESTGITGLGDEAVTLTDTSITAETLKTLDGKTSGAINAGTVTSLTGDSADLTTAYGSSGITGLGDEAITLSDTSIAATVLNSLDGKTTGKIDASKLTKITGTGADAKTAFESAGITLTFDASNYLASYTDLLAAFGSNLTLAKNHFFDHGVSEGRSFDAFDETSYLAGYSDLLAAFGTNTDSALIHYINHGYSEGRTADAFDANSYLASNTSLIGTVTDAAAHYVSTGYAAGLALDSFDEYSYLASNTSLIGTVTTATADDHFVSTGYAAGNSADSFDELAYIASYTDLIAAFGTDGAAGTKHYVEFGTTEGRTVTFDAASYLAGYADLRAAFGTDQEAAKKHYIVHGSGEGRTFS